MSHRGLGCHDHLSKAGLRQGFSSPVSCSDSLIWVNLSQMLVWTSDMIHWAEASFTYARWKSSFPRTMITWVFSVFGRLDIHMSPYRASACFVYAERMRDALLPPKLLGV